MLIPGCNNWFYTPAKVIFQNCIHGDSEVGYKLMILLCFLISGIETRHNQIKDGFRFIYGFWCGRIMHGGVIWT